MYIIYTDRTDALKEATTRLSAEQIGVGKLMELSRRLHSCSGSRHVRENHVSDQVTVRRLFTLTIVTSQTSVVYKINAAPSHRHRHCIRTLYLRDAPTVGRACIWNELPSFTCYLLTVAAYILATTKMHLFRLCYNANLFTF